MASYKQFVHSSRWLLRYEWQGVLRSYTLLVILSVLLLTGGYALFYGHSVAMQRMVVMDSLRQDYRSRYDQLYGQLSADTTTAQGKSDYAAAISPAVVEYRLYRTAHQEAAAFSALSIGVSDIANAYYPVRIKDIYQAAEEKISNPQQLVAGNFDLAFLVIYLLPLLAIGFSYQLLSLDKEQGTLALLTIQGGGVVCVLLFRLLLRYLLLLAGVLLLTFAGLLLAPAGSHFRSAELLFWIGITGIYLAFWMALIWFVISWNRSSATNLVALLFSWLLLLVIIPALVHFSLVRTATTDHTAVNASRQREIAWETWDLPQKDLLDSFYLRYPVYRNQSAYDTSELSMRRSMAYYQLAEDRMDRVLAAQEATYQQELGMVMRAYSFSPSVYAQALLNRIAQTDVLDQSFFRERVRVFRDSWKHYMYDFNFNDRTFKAADYATLPVYVPTADPGRISMLSKGLLYFGLLSAAFALAGTMVLRRTQG
ncbi:DUF3526 domain-containing protein [Chitinophaga pendula]|uniref:DUF3526 domain-containing protein n=1 Tax=Chitinophaga TaxID=79328 RepID=UPI0018E04A1A|nr:MULTISPECIES: DUF3526 domain-containing protein [Chitinophaga]UCJ09676.1 DUF3526 domain-containing protein [Chitinophaga pendula]